MKAKMSHRRQVVYLLIALALFALIAMFLRPAPQTLGAEEIILTPHGRLCVGLLVAAIFLWVTEALPFHITALAVMLVMPFLRITDGMSFVKDGALATAANLADGYRQLVAISFGNDLILFFLGVFLLSAAFSETTLGRRMTLKMLRLIGTNARVVILGFLIMGTLISMWVSDVGVAAMMLPIGVAILKQAKCKPLESNFGRGLMIASCWGAIIGGIGTPAGCGPNPIAINFMREFAGMKITFLDWMQIGVPASLLMVPLGWLTLIWLFPPEFKHIPITPEDIRGELAELGPLSRPEWGTIAIFAVVIFLWVAAPFLGKIDPRLNLPISFVSVLGGILLFLPPFRVLNWEQANRAISWESIILIMASLGLGMMTYHTGAAKWLAVTLLSGVGSLNPLALIFVVVVVVIVLKLFLASNTVTGIIIIPILISLAQALGVHPWVLVGPAAFTSSLGIILVTQTPTNIIPYTSGYFTIKDFAISGVIMSLGMCVVITAVIAILGPLTGMYQY